jgi:hypothetical protein
MLLEDTLLEDKCHIPVLSKNVHRRTRKEFRKKHSSVEQRFRCGAGLFI